MRVAKQNEALYIHRARSASAFHSLGEVDPALAVPLLALRQSQALCRSAVEPMLIAQLHTIAERTLPHLGPERRRELWIDATWLGCDPSLVAPAVRPRLALYRAIAARDAGAMHALATEMLTARDLADPEWQRFLLSTAMLDALASGRTSEAQDLWARHVDRLYPDRQFPSHVVILVNWNR